MPSMPHWSSAPEYANPARRHNYAAVQRESAAMGIVNAAGIFFPVFLVRIGGTNVELGLLTAIPALTGFLLVSAVFLVCQLGAVYWVTSTQEIAHETASDVQPDKPNGGPSTTETTPGAVPEAGADALVVKGKDVFKTAGCESCHTLSDAGSTGSVGPNLDDAKPSAARVIDRVTNGKSPMPSFKGQLTADEIKAVAAYVSTVAGKSS